MKICLFADAQSVHIRQLTQHLTIRGHQIHIITNKPADLPGATVERYVVPQPGVTNFRRWEGRRRKYLRDIFRQFDVVNVHFLADWGLEEMLADREPCDARVVATAWGSDIVDPPGETPASPLLTEGRRSLLRSADAVTTCGMSFARTVADYAQVPIEQIQVIPFGVNLSLFNPGLENTESENSIVGFFKGFRPVYGATVLLRAIPLILERIPTVRFDMIGDGVELAHCRALAAEFGVNDAITWFGRLDHSHLPRRISQWRLSAIPSIHEAFGVAALESQAMRVPVVASRVGGLVDTIQDGKSGILFPAGSHEALADSVMQLLSDHARSKQMGIAGYDKVRREFDWRGIAAQWEHLYERVRELAVCTI